MELFTQPSVLRRQQTADRALLGQVGWLLFSECDLSDGIKAIAMERYKNLSGRSGVRGFELGDDQIVVIFNDGGSYLYDSVSPGPGPVSEMKELAQAGEGLNSFISRFVKKSYRRKLG